MTKYNNIAGSFVGTVPLYEYISLDELLAFLKKIELE